MDTIMSLWLPIVVATAGCFVASSLIWMVLGYHKADWQKLPDEEAMLELVRKQQPKPGWYMFPYCLPEDFTDPAAKARYERGPWGTVAVAPGLPAMGRSLLIWFIHLLIVATVVAYVAGTLRGPGTDFSGVAKVVAPMALLVFAGHELPGMAWKAQPGAIALRNLIDAAIYAAIFAVSFGALWPN